MSLAHVLEVLDDALIVEDKEAVACVLILLFEFLGTDPFLRIFNLLAQVLFLIDLPAEAEAAEAALDAYLPPNNILLVFALDVVQLVD